MISAVDELKHLVETLSEEQAQLYLDAPELLAWVSTHAMLLTLSTEEQYPEEVAAIRRCVALWQKMQPAQQET